MALPAFAVNLRMDCRFYGTGSSQPQYCYSSATYSLIGTAPNVSVDETSIHFGVGCDHQTIYNNNGTALPVDTIVDHFRPTTAATPLVELQEQGDLRNPGSYTAKLEIPSGILLTGHCYVVTAAAQPSIE